MADSTSDVRAEFDRIALLASEEGWNQNSHYHDFLLRHVPLKCERALEVGCGAGEFSRRLAGRARQVLALDLSPEMIRLALERSGEFPNITFQVGDATRYDFPAEEFDVIATIATMHHLPFELMLSKFKRALKAGGLLLVLDLFEPETLADYFIGTLALPVSISLRLIKQGRLRPPAQVRATWAEHERHDSFPPLSRVRAVCAKVLPGALIRRHLLWRYSVVWKKIVV